MNLIIIPLIVQELLCFNCNLQIDSFRALMLVSIGRMWWIVFI
jgi:hypothetical protein